MSDEMREELQSELKHYENEIRKIDVEMAKLQGMRKAFEDTKTMLFELLHKELKNDPCRKLNPF